MFAQFLTFVLFFWVMLIIRSSLLFWREENSARNRYCLKVWRRINLLCLEMMGLSPVATS